MTSDRIITGGPDEDLGPEPEQPGIPEGEARLSAVERSPGTVTVRLDDGRDFAVAPAAVPASLPAIGQPVAGEILAELAGAAARKRAAGDLLALLDRRLQPVARLRQALLKRGHDPAAVQRVLADMQAQGLCSDRLYAEAYCRDCLLTRAVGVRYLMAKLQQKGIPGAVAQAAVAAVLSGPQEAELAAQAARSRWERHSGPVEAKAVAKVVRFLLGRGFPPAVATEAARREQPAGPATRPAREDHADPGDRR